MQGQGPDPQGPGQGQRPGLQGPGQGEGLDLQRRTTYKDLQGPLQMTGVKWCRILDVGQKCGYMC